MFVCPKSTLSCLASKLCYANEVVVPCLLNEGWIVQQAQNISFHRSEGAFIPNLTNSCVLHLGRCESWQLNSVHTRSRPTAKQILVQFIWVKANGATTGGVMVDMASLWQQRNLHMSLKCVHSADCAWHHHHGHEINTWQSVKLHDFCFGMICWKYQYKK